MGIFLRGISTMECDTALELGRDTTTGIVQVQRDYLLPEAIENRNTVEVEKLLSHPRKNTHRCSEGENYYSKVTGYFKNGKRCLVVRTFMKMPGGGVRSVYKDRWPKSN